MIIIDGMLHYFNIKMQIFYKYLISIENTKQVIINYRYKNPIEIDYSMGFVYLIFNSSRKSPTNLSYSS